MVALYALLTGSKGIDGKSIAQHYISFAGMNTIAADTTTLNGQWFLQPVLSSDTAAGRIPVLHIDVASRTFTGNTGCNAIRGSFQKTDTSLAFGHNMVTTKMNCAGYDETAFIRSLERANRYKFENGLLILMFDATELSRWTRKPDRTIKMNKA